MPTDQSNPTPPGAFGPAKKFLRQGSSREHHGMQAVPARKPTVGTEERAPLAAEGSISPTTVQERIRQRIAEREKLARQTRHEHGQE